MNTKHRVNNHTKIMYKDLIRKHIRVYFNEIKQLHIKIIYKQVLIYKMLDDVTIVKEQVYCSWSSSCFNPRVGSYMRLSQ